MTAPTQSTLLTLPGELKNEIFALALSSPVPITNPCYNSSNTLAPTPTKYAHIPPLGASLTQTCRLLHSEIDTRTLYTDNVFTFTRISHIHSFCAHLSREKTRWITNLTLDLREAAASPTSTCTAKEAEEEAERVGNEWLHYLTCNHLAHAPGLWCFALPTLHSDLPDLRSLSLDLTNYLPRHAAQRRSHWKYLQRLLGNLKGMEKIAIKGRLLDASCWNPRPKPWGLSPWFSPAFLEEDVALLELLGGVVRDAEVSDGEEKVFTWAVKDGLTTLEVKVVAPSARKQETKKVKLATLREVPESGAVAWEDFLEYKKLRQGEQAAESESSGLS